MMITREQTACRKRVIGCFLKDKPIGEQPKSADERLGHHGAPTTCESIHRFRGGSNIGHGFATYS